VKAALLAPLLALATPLAAQEGEPAPAAPALAAEPGPIVLVSGSDRLTALLGEGPVDPDTSLCLEPGEEAVFTSDRVTFTLSGGSAGGACFTPEYGERKAFDAEEREAALQALEQAQDAYAAALAGGDAEEIKRAEAALQDAQSRRFEWVLQSEPMVVGSPPSTTRGVITPKASAPRKRTRTGAPRAAAAPPPPPPPRPVIFRIASGSPAALARFPRGTLVQRGTALCLKAGEQVTVAGNNGQSATYTGPGCLNRSARPTRENVGGFTFG